MAGRDARRFEKRRSGKRSGEAGSNGKEAVLARQSGNGRSQNRRKKRSKEEFEDYSIVDPSEIEDGPDVLIDVPAVKVDEIEVEVEDLQAQVALMAQVGDLVKLGVGAEVRLGKVELQIKGVEAQALLKARLHNVSGILERVLTTLDRNPELVESIGRSVEEVGSGAGHMIGETGEAVEETGEGAGEAVEGLGQGVGQLGSGGG
jgi:hypothetical protein